MGDIVLKSLGFLAVIITANLLKRAGLFRKEDGQTLSRLMMNVTMPCALLSAGQNLELSGVLLAVPLLAVACNLVLVFGGIVLAKGEGRQMRGIFAINASGFNVGSFALPFVQYFFPASVLSYVCMFDMGNAVMNLGVNNTIASAVASSDVRPSAKIVVRRLLTMPPFAVYIVVIALALLGLSVPSGVLTLVSIAGDANAFVAMAMIGIMLEIQLPKKDIRLLARLLAGRYAIVLAIGLLIWFLLPVSAEIRQALILCVAAPVTSTAPLFTLEMIGKSDLPAAVNSLSILISLAVMTGLMLVFA